MLNEHTLNHLRSLRLDGLIRAIEDQATSTAAAGLSFDERLTLLVQREVAWRDDRRVQRAAQGGQAQGQLCLHRGHQLARQPRAGPRPHLHVGRRRLAAPCAQLAHHRGHRQR